MRALTEQLRSMLGTPWKVGSQAACLESEAVSATFGIRAVDMSGLYISTQRGNGTLLGALVSGEHKRGRLCHRCRDVR